MVMEGKFEWTMEEAFMVSFKILFQNLRGENEDNHRKCQVRIGSSPATLQNGYLSKTKYNLLLCHSAVPVLMYIQCINNDDTMNNEIQQHNITH
jgi:hypothetical protein